MKKFRKLQQKASIPLSLFTAVLWLILLMCVSYRIPAKFYKMDPYLPQLVIDAVMAVFGSALILLMGYGSVFREHREGLKKGLLTGGYFLLVGLNGLIVQMVGADHGHLRSVGQILIFTVTMLMIGIAEEVTFRGVIATLLLRQYGTSTSGIWFCTIVSGILFGCPHLVNAIGGNVAWIGVLVQAVSAVGSGMIFTAIYYRTKNIWVVALLHAWIDFAGLSASGFFGDGSIGTVISSYSPTQMLSVIPYIIITAYLLRKEKMEQILERK